MQTLAIAVKQSLPLSVIQVLTAPEWSGGRLLQLADDTSRPAANDLILNFYWLKPVAAKFPTTVPSGFFCTDLFLYLHHLFMEGLFKVQNDGDTVRSLAAHEGNNMKRLLQALRFLWRSSNSAACVN